MAPPTAARNSRLAAVAGQMPPGSDHHPIVRRGVEHAVAGVRRNGVAVIDAVLDPDTVIVVARDVLALVMADVEARMAEGEALAAAGETRIDVWPEERGVVHLCLDVGDDRFQPLVTPWWR